VSILKANYRGQFLWLAAGFIIAAVAVLIFRGAPQIAETVIPAQPGEAQQFLSFSSAARYLWSSSSQNGIVLSIALLTVILPGLVFVPRSVGRKLRYRMPVKAAIAVAASLSIWPIIWLWSSVAGTGWTGIAGAGLLLAFAGMAVIRRSDFTTSSRRQRGSRPAGRYDWAVAVVAFVLVLGLRLLAARGLNIAPWVDSVRHAVIGQIMIDSGAVPESFRPFIDVDRFTYHFGFHAWAAVVARLSGASMAGLLLTLQQVMSALVSLSIFGATLLISRRPRAAWIAAFLVTLPLLFPGYYSSWGRLTQLAGIAVLAILVAATWLAASDVGKWRSRWWLIGLLVSGLFLVHVRLFLIYLPFAALTLVVRRGRGGKALLSAAALTALLTAPWLWRLLSHFSLSNLTHASVGYNDVPWAYVKHGWEEYFLAATAVAMLLSLAAFARRRSWAAVPALLTVWSLVIGLVILLGRFGLPSTWVLNFNSVYISFFLPQAIILAVVADRLWQWSSNGRRVRSATTAIVGGAVAAVLLLYGVRQQLTAINPGTILADPADRTALDWIEAETDSDAVFAISSWRWLGRAWSGTDGGAWIVPYTGRQSTTPPADYTLNPELERHYNSFNEQASLMESWSGEPATRLLREIGATHVYIGRRQGFFRVNELMANESLRLVYESEGVYILELSPEHPG